MCWTWVGWFLEYEEIFQSLQPIILVRLHASAYVTVKLPNAATSCILRHFVLNLGLEDSLSSKL